MGGPINITLITLKPFLANTLSANAEESCDEHFGIFFIVSEKQY